MNKQSYTKVAAGAVAIAIALWALWADANDRDHLTKQPDGSYK